MALSADTPQDKLALIKQLLISEEPGWAAGIDLFPYLVDLLALAAGPPGWIWGGAEFAINTASQLSALALRDSDAPCTDYKCRLAAAVGLGKLGAKEALLPLATSFQHDPNYNVRGMAIAAARGLLDESVEPGVRYAVLMALQQVARADKSDYVRQLAQKTFAEHKQLLPETPEASPLATLVAQINAGLASASASVREAALITIQQGRLAVYVPQLFLYTSEATEDDPRVRVRAVQTLAGLLSRALAPALLKGGLNALARARKDSDPTVRAAAQQAYAQTRWLRVSKPVLGLLIAGAVAGVGLLTYWAWPKRPARQLVRGRIYT